MEKAACALLAERSVIEKPGTPTALLAAHRGAGGRERCGARGRLPVHRGLGPRTPLDHMTSQDSLAFTGSSHTAAKLRGHGQLVKHNVRVNLEADSLNAAVLAPDVEAGSDTFNRSSPTSRSTWRRRPGRSAPPCGVCSCCASASTSSRPRSKPRSRPTRSGDRATRPRAWGLWPAPISCAMSALGIERLAKSARSVCGGAAPIRDKGYFVAPTLFVAPDARTSVVHTDEVFGPVATILPYAGSAREAVELVGLGGGSLVTSVYSNDVAFLETAALGIGAWSGRVWLGSDKMAEQALAPGMVLPQMIHGGPGRAGGGEELGALRGLASHLQRVPALQGFKGDRARVLRARELRAPGSRSSLNQHRRRSRYIPRAAVRAALWRARALRAWQLSVAHGAFRSARRGGRGRLARRSRAPVGRSASDSAPTTRARPCWCRPVPRP